jgi:hypothetical protein
VLAYPAWWCVRPSSKRAKGIGLSLAPPENADKVPGFDLTSIGGGNTGLQANENGGVRLSELTTVDQSGRAEDRRDVFGPSKMAQVYLIGITIAREPVGRSGKSGEGRASEFKKQ